MSLVLGGLLAIGSSCTDDKRRGTAGSSCLSTDDCIDPLPCIANVCGAPPGTGGSGGTTHSSSGGSATGGGGSGGAGGDAAGGGGSAAGGSGGTGGTGGTGGQSCDGIGPLASQNVCDDCLDNTCRAEICACTDACVAIEGCIETLCRALDDVAEEGACQVYCQNQHPGGKNPHLAVVNCAYTGSCIPPCQAYPVAWNDCRATMMAGDCADELASCQVSAECVAYQTCTDTCTTAAECIACSATVPGATGRILLEALEKCVATECVLESWAY